MRSRSPRRVGSGVIAIAAALVIVVMGGGCALDGPQSTLHPGGPVARLQADVFFVSLMVCLGVFVVTAGLLVYTVWHFRAKGGQEATSLIQTYGNPKIELALIGVVFLLLLVIAVPNIRALFAASVPPAGEEVLPIQVIGQQWWWTFAYPTLGVVTANELHVPAGRAVQVHLRSADVIHRFWIPRLAGKMDLMPNQENQMWFKAEKPGVYFGQCAEFCGTSHAHMGFRVVAQTAADFAAWVQTQQRPAPAPTEPLAVQGAQLSLQKGCIACHAIDGTLAQGTVGPNLTHVGSRQTLAAGALANTPDNLARWLKNPQAVKPASLMPNLALDDASIAALVAYLQGLK